MSFTEHMSMWLNSELLQGKIMIGIGVPLAIAFIAIFRSENELLRGGLIPVGLLVVIMIGYGGYILYSRPAHAKTSVALYEKSPQEGISKEIEKHVNDNKAGKALIGYVYPLVMIISVIAFLIISSPYYKGMALGFVLFSVSAYIIDYGFVSRSDTFIAFLETIK